MPEGTLNPRMPTFLVPCTSCSLFVICSRSLTVITVRQRRHVPFDALETPELLLVPTPDMLSIAEEFYALPARQRAMYDGLDEVRRNCSATLR